MNFFLNNFRKSIVVGLILLAFTLAKCTPIPNRDPSVTRFGDTMVVVTPMKVRHGWLYNEVLVTNMFYAPIAEVITNK